MHVHTEYSLLDGASRISKLVKIAKEDGADAVAMTDHGNMYGAYKFYKACKDVGIKPILGCEIYIVDDLEVKEPKEHRAHLILLAKNNAGYFNLCKINTTAWTKGFYYKPRIDYKFLAEHSEGVICLSACLAGHIPYFLLQGEYDTAKKYALRLKQIFGADFYLELQDHNLPEQRRVNPELIKLAGDIGVKLVATNDVHYLRKEDAEMQDALMCISTQSKVADTDRMKFGSDEFYYKSTDEMRAVINGIDRDKTDEIFNNVIEIAAKCDCNPFGKRNLIPAFTTPTGETNAAYFRRLAEDGLKKYYGEITPQIKERFESEFNIIERQGFIDYFLIVADFMRFANENDIPVGPGRGSGAGSIIAYALGITKLDPFAYDLLFERFLHGERKSMPDFDLDFCCKRRGEVIDYVTKKYGEDHICQIVTFGTMAAKAAIKDMARVFDIPYAEVDKVTKPIEITQTVKPPYLQYIFGLKDVVKPKADAPDDEQEKYKKEKRKAAELFKPELAEMYKTDETVRRIVDMAIKVEGFPRNCSVHAAGVIICKEVVGNVCPLAKNGDSVTSQFDKQEVEDLGFLKMDFLGLITCTDIDGAVKDIRRQLGEKIDFYNMEYNDPNVYQMIADGDTDAVFQLESGGMKRFMKELKPDRFEDIIAGVALYRPGPMDMIPNYCRNKHNPKLTVYDHPMLEPILKKTYGQIVYQEQVMEIFKQLGGYSLGQADIIRSAMGKKKVAEMAKHKKIFVNGDKSMGIAGAVANGVPKDLAVSIFAKMEKFAGYAFNKSHAACYAFLAYQTAYLKYYYYSFFMASMLNNRINKWEDMVHYIAQMRIKNATILPPDINKSESVFVVELNERDKDNPIQPVRFGLSAIKNVGEGVVTEIIAERQNGDYRDFIDFCRRAPNEALNKRCLESLILSGSFDTLGLFRTQLMAIYPAVVKVVSAERGAAESGQISMFGAGSSDARIDVPIPKIPEYNNFDKLKFEREYVGLYLSGHPLDEYTEIFSQYSFNTGYLEKKETEDDGQPADDTFDVAERKPETITFGAIINEAKRIYTRANREEMAVLTVEDLYGTCDVMVFPKVWIKVKAAAVKDTVVKIMGRVSNRDGDNAMILAENIEPLTAKSGGMAAEVSAVKKLYLRFNLGDEELKDSVMTVLSAYSGELPVVIKDTSTGNAMSPKNTVRDCRAIMYELNSILGEENVVLK